MREAMVNGRLVLAGPDSPDEALCPSCGGAVKKRKRRRVVFGHTVAFPDAVVEADWLRPNAPREIIIGALDLVSLEKRLREALTFWRGEHPTDVPPGRSGVEVLVRLLGQSRDIRHPLLAEQARADQQAIVCLTERRYLLNILGERDHLGR